MGLRPIIPIKWGVQGSQGPHFDTPGGGSATPLRGGPPDPPSWAGAQGGKLSPPGDGGHLTDFVAN